MSSRAASLGSAVRCLRRAGSASSRSVPIFPKGGLHHSQRQRRFPKTTQSNCTSGQREHRCCRPGSVDTRSERQPTGRADNGESEVRRSEEHTSELQSRVDLVCRLLLEKKKKN